MSQARPRSGAFRGAFQFSWALGRVLGSLTESGIVFRRVVTVLVASALVVPGLTAGASGPPSFSLPDQASEVAPGVFFLGHAVEDGVALVGYAYARYASTDERGRRANAKPDGTPGNGKGGGGGDEEAPTAESCYSYIASGAKWINPEVYLFNSANDNIGNITLAETDGVFDTWDTAAGSNAVKPGSAVTTELTADTSRTDGLNEIYFAPIDDANVLGYTIVWYTRSRGPFIGQIVEADMVIDSGPEWDWYTTDAFGKNQIDFWSVFTHEAGHWVGMGHTDTSVLCAGQTMSPFINSDDLVSKRALGLGDIAGVSSLY